MRKASIGEIVLALLSTAALCVPGCGGGTGTGNPSRQDITLASRAYNSTTALHLKTPLLLDLLPSLVPNALAASPTITSLWLCLEKIELKAEDDSPILGEGGSLPELKIGMVALGDGTSAVTWGQATLPLGAAIKRLKVVVHKSPELCGGAEYSMSVNGQTITKDIELKFAYASPKPLAAGDTITFSLATLVSKLTQAYLAGQFSDQYISAYLDGSFEDDAH